MVYLRLTPGELPGQLIILFFVLRMNVVLLNPICLTEMLHICTAVRIEYYQPCRRMRNAFVSVCHI